MENAGYTFRNLILWQKAQDLALEIVRVAATLPKHSSAQVIGRQIVASAASVGANIAEGHGRFSIGAHRNHLSIARGSACETDGWLDLLRRAGYIDAVTEERLHQDCVEIIRMLSAKMLDLERREVAARRNRTREERVDYDPAEHFATEDE